MRYLEFRKLIGGILRVIRFKIEYLSIGKLNIERFDAGNTSTGRRRNRNLIDRTLRFISFKVGN